MNACKDVAGTVTGCLFVGLGLAVFCLGIDLLMDGNLVGLTFLAFGALSKVFGVYLIVESNTGETFTLREHQVVELRVLEDSPCQPTSFVVVSTTV